MRQLNLLTRRFRDSIFLLGKILAGALVADPADVLLVLLMSQLQCILIFDASNHDVAVIC
jgi:hypothetical protein